MLKSFVRSALAFLVTAALGSYWGLSVHAAAHAGSGLLSMNY